MTDIHDDSELAELFARLRAAESGGAPSYDRIRRSGMQPHRTRFRVPVLVAVAAGVVVLGAAVAVLRLRQSNLEPGIEAARRIAAWRSPTGDPTAMGRGSRARSGSRAGCSG